MIIFYLVTFLTFRGAKVGIILQYLQKYFHKKHFSCTRSLFLCIFRAKRLYFYISTLQKSFFAIGTFSFQMVKDNFADSHTLGSYFHVLISLDVFQRLL